jgi:branched-chain amino acid aminotransferase
MTEPTSTRETTATDRDSWPVVLDGELTRLGEATIPAGDEGLIRGDGAFDAFPVRDGRPFARSAHLDRLERSCRALLLDCPRDVIEADIDLLLGEAGPGYLVVRTILTRGGRRLSILESHGDLDALSRPARMVPITYEPSVVLNGVKTLSYGANMLASRQAAAAGYDEALLVATDGTVLEGPTCSVFWKRDAALRTPSLDLGILASITRRVVLESVTVEEGRFPLDDLLAADEAFLVSTARIAQPIAAIGERSFPVAPGPETRQVHAAIERAMDEGSIA